MRFVKPSAPDTSGAEGVPTLPPWKREWLENKVRWVELKCGCVMDSNDRTLAMIYAFKGCEILCESHGHFSSVVRTLTRRTPVVKLPDTPLF